MTNPLRENFRLVCLTRDQWRCRSCGADVTKCAYDVHHIMPRDQMPGGGYVLQNGITLCSGCHVSAERYLQITMVIGDMDFALSPKALYALIGTTYAEAVAASEELAESGSNRGAHGPTTKETG